MQVLDVPSTLQNEVDSERREYARRKVVGADVEARLDEALCETFPASDPIAVSPGQ